MDLHAQSAKLSFPQPGGEALDVLNLDSLTIHAGEKVVFTGPSGAGKTTLINALVGIQPLDEGQVVWNGQDIYSLSERARDLWRRKYVGIIFQDFFLFPGLSILDNILLPFSFGRSCKESLEKESRKAAELLDLFRLPDGRRSIRKLSRGERQRVAILRAVLTEPPVLLADEPTANLDRENADKVWNLIMDMCNKLGSTLLLVSHDLREVGAMDREIRLEKGTASL